MELLTGASGWSYPAWKGTFYPPKLAAKGFLAFYSSRLRTVELNATFYRMPKADVVKGWREQTPEGFAFAVKLPQRFSHILRLVDCADSFAHFVKVIGELGPTLGPLLLQLPPNFPKALDRLQGFHDLLPAGFELAFEPRHPSWLDEEVLTELRARNIALVVTDGDDAQIPPTLTAPFGYVRLRRESYDDGAMAAVVGSLRAAGWQRVYAYFKHEATAPALAAALAQRFGDGS